MTHKPKPFELASGEACKIIAEIGSNFNGSLSLAKESIDAALEVGADAVKFQTYSADEFVADKNLKYSYQNSDGKIITENQYDMFQRLELSAEWHSELQHYAQLKGGVFLSSSADKNAVDLLESLHVPVLKFASEDLINVFLLEYAATKQTPVILSTGMADQMEIDQALKLFSKNQQRQIILFHCTSLYPTPAQSCNLKRITALKEHYQLPVGFSDHTQGSAAAAGAVALGACAIEKHFTLDNNLEGPDHQMSANPDDLKELVLRVREMEVLLGDKTLNYDDNEIQARSDFRRSIVASRNIQAGEKLERNMLNFKRPGNGLKPYELEKVIKQTLKHGLSKNEQILLSDIV